MKKEEKNSRSITKKISSIATGSIVLSVLGFSTNTNATDLFSFNSLGSGSELRNELLIKNNASNILDIQATHEGKVKESKCGEGKCGEGKCGEKGKEGKDKGKTKEAKPKATK